MRSWTKAGAAALTALAALLAACGDGPSADTAASPAGRSGPVTAPDTRIDAVAEEEPGVARTQWRVEGAETRSSVGNLRVTILEARGGPLALAFAEGITLRVQQYDTKPANQSSGVSGRSLAAVLDADPRVRVYLYRVLDEDLIREVRGGLCGDAPTRHLAIAEFVDPDGNWAFKVAAFKGEAGPGGADPELCRVFAFTAL